MVALTVEPEQLIRRLLARSRTGDRSDDSEAVIRKRQELYLTETVPLLSAYRQRDEVAQRIEAASAQRISAGFRTLDKRSHP